MKIGLVVPGFSADAGDWCIPALRNLARQLATTEEVHVLALRYPYRPSGYAVFGAQVRALGGGRLGHRHPRSLGSGSGFTPKRSPPCQRQRR